MKSIRAIITSILVAAPLMVPFGGAFAQQAAMDTSGPIDIQADEQEFAGDAVVAKGNVRVKYKDSVVFAPIATLFKDAGGNPQRAVFTGHPRLIQGQNKIDAQKLTFEVANSKVIAEGGAHSEIASSGDDKEGKNSTLKNAVKEDDDEKDPKTAGAVRPRTEQTANAVYEQKPKNKVVEKIMTDADRQEYDRTTGNFIALGHVHVVHGDILVKSDKLSLVYGIDGKPETALFTGNVAATQNRNTTLADTMTYALQTRRLQATGHVKSTVIQDKKEDPKKKKTASADPLGMPAANAATTENKPLDDIVVITSDAQDFSNDSGRMSAVGHVKVFYEDLIGAGPAAVLVKNSLGKADRIIFNGRSQITQPDKRWIADHIEMTVADKKVSATGNSRAIILKPPTQQPSGGQSQVAGRPAAISATKVDSAK